MLELYDLKTMHMKSPVIDKEPYFSWKLKSDRRNVMQEAYQIVVKRQEKIVWDSGKREAREQAFVEYQGEALCSRCDYDWMVTVWDNQGEKATAGAAFSTALLQKTDWTAKWVECPFTREPANEYKFGNTYAAVLFEKQIPIAKGIKKAMAYATGHGTYRLTVNGRQPDDREFAPEFTPYDRVLYYQTYDLTALLKEGENTFAMYVADGWYFSAQAGPVMPDRHDEPSVLFQIEIAYEDGTEETVCSDGSETCRTDFIVYSDLYQGEKQDYTLPQGEKKTVLVKEYGYGMLMAQPLPEIAAIELLPAVEVFTSPAGETIVDFGQVLAGRARIHMDIPAGQQAVFEYFEVLNSEGNYLNTMFAPQKDTYVSDGRERIYEALFTFHGFRYIRVTGLENVKKEDFTAVLLSTRKDNYGTFRCSDGRLNRLYQNIRFSQYNNMMSVPTDCPSREKAGWTGDILIYARTALLNEDMTPFLSSWLNSVREDQAEDGVVMIVSPYMKLYDGMLKEVVKTFGDDLITGVAGWSDAIVWVPYDMYQVTGNVWVLEDNFKAMEKWAEYIIRTAASKRGGYGIPDQYDRYLWNTGFHFGEWLIPGRKAVPGEGPYDACRESDYYIAPFFGYQTMRKMAEIARVLEREDRAAYYADMAGKMGHAIQKGIFEGGLMPERYMGAYILAFAFGLVPENLKEPYKQKIVDLIHRNGDCLDTGFLATPYILDVLCDLGEKDLAYRLLWQDKMPSWLYEVDHGATSVWEAWDADEAQKSGRYVSFDHYAFGCVDDWICKHVAGIDSDAPGFAHVVIHPDTEGRITDCERSFESEAGKILVSWNRDRLYVEIPCNVTATVHWKGKVSDVGSGIYEFHESD